MRLAALLLWAGGFALTSRITVSTAETFGGLEAIELAETPTATLESPGSERQVMRIAPEGL